MRELIISAIKAIGFERSARAFKADIGALGSRINLKPRQTDADILFVWIPKTAGSSVFTALSNCFGMKKLKSISGAYSFTNRGAVTFGHQCLNSLCSVGVVNNSYLHSAYKFAFTRDPYERAVSLYNYLVQHRKVPEHRCFLGFLEDVHHKRPNIGLYNTATLSQANPQTDWLIDRNGDFLVDHTFDLSQMSQFLDEIDRRFGKRPIIERHNVSDKKISVENALINSDAKELIELIYSRDFDVLNYEKSK